MDVFDLYYRQIQNLTEAPLQRIARGYDFAPSPGVQEVLAPTGIEETVGKLAELFNIDIEKGTFSNGQRMFIILTWPPNPSQYNRVALSIRENSISFTGDEQRREDKQYFRLEGVDARDTQLAHRHLFQVLLNPARIEK